MNDWEDISSQAPPRPQVAQLPQRDPPPYSRPAGPPRLRILGATWGGVQVTEDIQSMVSATETVTLDMRTLSRLLQPDPVFGTVKTLSVLYTYEQGDQGGQGGDICLVSISEQEQFPVEICATAQRFATRSYSIRTLKPPFWRAAKHDGGDGEVEILAALYGPQRIETPRVLEELGKFFEGRRGQIRMTNSFFKADTWPDHRKSWTIYFRFVGSDRIQVVTGMEDGALEVPWSRY